MKTSPPGRHFRLHGGEVLFCSNQPSMSSESLRTIWTSASCRTTGNGAFPLVPFLALPPYLARTHRQELLRNLITILLPIPLSSNVRKERCKIVLSRNCQESTAIGAAMTFNTACNHRLPFVSPFTAPPDFFVTSRPELLRLFIAIALFTPLSSNFRIQRCKIILSRNCQVTSAVRAAVSLAAIAHARSPGMSFLTPPPIAVIVKVVSNRMRYTLCGMSRSFGTGIDCIGFS